MTVALDSTQSQFAKYIDPDVLDYLQHQQKLFDQCRSVLSQTHAGLFVWFEDEKVLDADVEEEKLFERVMQLDPDQTIFIAQVLPVEAQLKVRSAFLQSS